MAGSDSQAAEWVTKFVLGAVAALSVEDRPKTVGSLTGSSGAKYLIGQTLASTNEYTLYVCVLPSGRCGILKIAKAAKFNGSLDKEAFILKMMAAKASEVEAAIDPVSKPYNYQYFFPAVVESFICESQGNRRVNVLGFPDPVDEIGQLTPLSSLIEKERVRVDPRTAAWMVGKSFKVLSFAHGQGIVNNQVLASNILIEKEQHGVVFFNWSQVTMYPDGIVPQDIASREIALIACLGISLMGGNPNLGTIPDYYQDQLTDNRFMDLLRLLSWGKISDAGVAHAKFYKLIRELWPRYFHPYTAYPRE